MSFIEVIAGEQALPNGGRRLVASVLVHSKQIGETTLAAIVNVAKTTSIVNGIKCGDGSPFQATGDVVDDARHSLEHIGIAKAINLAEQQGISLSIDGVTPQVPENSSQPNRGLVVINAYPIGEPIPENLLLTAFSSALDVVLKIG